MKMDYEQRIKAREKTISELEKENEKSRKEIHTINLRLDSIQKVKNKVEIKYINSKNKIKIMDADKIKDYWNEEFN